MAYIPEYLIDRTAPKGSPDNPLTSADYPRVVGLRAGVDQRKSDFLESLAKEEAMRQKERMAEEAKGLDEALIGIKLV